MDLNQDGHADILSGSYAARGIKPMAGVFQVLWGSAKGTFSKPTPLMGTDEKLLLIKPSKVKGPDVRRICTRPTAVDWDADGDLDLLVGNFEGTFVIFKGEGKGKFAPQSELVMIGGAPLKISGVHSDPVCVDWDSDGDLDILSGSSSGGVQWSENTAGKGKKIQLKPFQSLIDPAKNREAQWSHEPIKPSGSTRIWVDDLNGDGKLDILLGDSSRIQTLSEGTTKEQYQEKHKALNSQISKISNQMAKLDRKSTEFKKLRSDQSKLYGLMQNLGTSSATGFVWAYYQK